ncbi:flagellar motor protein MotB [bacterium]|nr:MAG: flagellar motor protein MotB [bacterium]
MAKKKNIIIKQGLDDWVMTYGDLMSLLLTFFVLIVSFSSMQESKFEQAAESLKEAFGVMAQPEHVIEINKPLIPRKSDNEADLEFLFEVRELEKTVLDEKLDDQIMIETREDGVLIRMPAPLLFQSGGAELLTVSQPLLDKLASLFRKFPGEVRVEGHTDDIPIKSTQFPSNWELSSARAVAVARYFQGLGIPPDRLAATGYGEYRPEAGNGTAEGRAANRRVEILLARISIPQASGSDLPLKTPVKEPERAPEPAPEPETETIEEQVPLILNPVTGKLGAPTGFKWK